jgi:hypothetical protein
MTDEELERRLGHHPVVGPPQALRKRVLESATGEPVRARLSVFDYATAALAAGLVLVAIAIEVPAPAPSDAGRQREALALAEALGDGPDAVQYAEFLISRHDEPDDPALAESAW